MGVADAVRTIVAQWDDGSLARGEVVGQFTRLLTATNIDEVVAAVPGEWHDGFVDHLRAISREGPVVRIFGGVYAYEMEGDPERRAAMKAELEQQQAAENAHFEQVVRPAIRAWVARRE